MAFWLTWRELDALRALDALPATWKTFKEQTWLALADKALVKFSRRPVLTDAGRAALALTRSCRVNAPSPILEGKS